MRASLDRNVFQAFCEFLDEENPWVSSELRVELSLERGQLKVDDYTRKEAATLVHRYFGTSKRVAEQEKKQFEELLAVRTQCTRNVWIKNLEQTKQSLLAQISFEKQRASIQKALIHKITKQLNLSHTPTMPQASFSDEAPTEREAYR